MGDCKTVGFIGKKGNLLSRVALRINLIVGRVYKSDYVEKFMKNLTKIVIILK